jgi:hypothetical protein
MCHGFLRTFDPYMVKHISFAVDDADYDEIDATKRDGESWPDWAQRAAQALPDAEGE